MDVRLAGGGIALGGLHEVAPASPSLADEAAATLFVAGCAARAARASGRQVVWALTAFDLYAPGLEQAGLAADMVLFSDAPPRRFVWRGETHVVVAGDGPERIHGEWWRREGEAAAVRDYYLVEDETGARFWLFRRGDGVDPATGDLSWHIHGSFG